MQAKLLWEGPWTVEGRILQISEWRESFQPAFEKLSSAAVWIQLHHVPMELWNGDVLETIASHFGKVLKIDEHTLKLTRSKFARICVEIDLDLPLQKGTWVNYGDNSVFIIALYEKLPVFCYNCGRVGHGESTCSFVSSRTKVPVHQQPSASSDQQMEVDDQRRGPGVVDARMLDCSKSVNPAPNLYDEGEEESLDFGAWLKPRGRSSRGRGRNRVDDRNPNSTRPAENEGQDLDTCHHSLEPPSRFPARGGRSRRGSAHATVHLSNLTAFPHLEKANTVDSFSPVDEGTSSRPETRQVISNPGTETLSSMEPPFPLLERPSDLEPPYPLPEKPSDTRTAPCSDLALLPLINLPKGTCSPLSCQTSTHNTLTNPQPSSPLLLSSVRHDDSDKAHSTLVNNLEMALHVPSKADLQMDDLDDSGSVMGSEDSGSPLEPDDDMLLSHFHKNIKLEALARRAPSKNKSRPKKGRSTSTS